MDMNALEQAIQDKVAAGRGRPAEERDIAQGEIASDNEENLDAPPALDPPPILNVPPPADGVEEREAAAAADAAEEALPDGATPEEVEAAREQAEEDFYVGRYRTKEDAEAGLKGKDSTIGRLGQRLGELERQLAERQKEPEQAAEVAPEAEELDVPAWTEWATHEISAGNAEQAAIRALEEGGLDGYRVVINSWQTAVDEDGEPDFEARAQAAQFNTEVMLALQQANQQQPAAPARAEPAPAAPAPTTSNEGERTAAQHIVEAKYPDWHEYTDSMERVITTMNPETQQFLQKQASMGIAGRADALEYIYLAARQQKAEAQRIADQRTATSGDAAIVAATVASAEATTSRTPQSAAETEVDKRRNELRKEWGLPK